jgi:hypothetical protein
MLDAHTDQLVLKHVVRKSMPRLYEHFEKMDVDLANIGLQWFLTGFIGTFETEYTFRLW